VRRSNPDGAADTALPILRYVRDDTKPKTMKRCPRFIHAQAGVIERVAAIAPDGLAVGWTAIEHQHGLARGVLCKPCEPLVLIVGRQVEEAVSVEDDVETAIKLLASHVVHQPFLIRQLLHAQRNQRRRRVDTRPLRAARIHSSAARPASLIRIRGRELVSRLEARG